jgi:hypothetical protein
MTMRRSFESVSFLAVLLLVAPSPAAAERSSAPPEVASAPGPAAYPDDDGLVLRQATSLVLDGEGKLTRSEESWVKNFTPWVNAHGYYDPNLDWNDARASLTVDLARTFTPDGRVLDARAESIVPNTASSLEQAAPFEHLRQITVSQVGIEEGSTTALAYTIADRRPTGIPLWGILEFTGPLPILDRAVSIVVPTETSLRWAATGCPIQHDASNEPAGTRHSFRMSRVAAVNVAELGGGHAGMCRLAFSTASDWTEVRAFLERRVAVALVEESAIAEKAREIVGDSGLDAERVAKVHAFVVDGIQTVRWPLDAFDYTLRAARDVLASGVGHSLEKAAVLVAMLRALGYDADVALAASERAAPLDPPSPVPLEEAWVRVASGPDVLWLDPTAPMERRGHPHLAGRAVLLLDGKAVAPETQPELAATQNRAALRLDLTLEDGAHELRVTGREEIDLGGLYNPVPGFDRSKDALTGLATSVASALGGGSAKEVAVGQKSAPLTALAANVDGGALTLPRDGRPIKLVLPRVPRAVTGESLQMHRRRRTLPLVVPAPAEERVDVALALPPGFEILAFPEPISLDVPAGSLEREVVLDGRKITVRTVLRLKEAVVAPASYEGLRGIFALLEAEGGRTILLQPPP